MKQQKFVWNIVMVLDIKVREQSLLFIKVKIFISEDII